MHLANRDENYRESDDRPANQRSIQALSPQCREVLRALSRGLTLTEISPDVWGFTGPWQDQNSSGVPREVMAILLSSELVDYGPDNTAILTASGRTELNNWAARIIQEGLQWSRLHGLRLET